MMAISFSDAPSENRLTMRPPAPLPRSPASLHNIVTPDALHSSSSRDSISSTTDSGFELYVKLFCVHNSNL